VKITASGSLLSLGGARGYEGSTESISGSDGKVAVAGFGLGSLSSGKEVAVARFNAVAAIWSRSPGILGSSEEGTPNAFVPSSVTVDQNGNIFVATNPGDGSAVGAIAEVSAGAVTLLWKSPTD